MKQIRTEVIKKRFGRTETIYYRVCDGCKKEWQVDEGRTCYDEWYCSECGGRLGFTI